MDPGRFEGAALRLCRHVVCMPSFQAHHIYYGLPTLQSGSMPNNVFKIVYIVAICAVVDYKKKVIRILHSSPTSPLVHDILLNSKSSMFTLQNVHADCMHAIPALKMLPSPPMSKYLSHLVLIDLFSYPIVVVYVSGCFVMESEHDEDVSSVLGAIKNKSHY